MDFNRAILSDTPISVAINDLIEAAVAAAPETNVRQYLGASSIGSECLRRIQFDWLVDAEHSFRLRDIFRRGHLFEAISKAHLVAAGFRFAPDRALAFAALDGQLRGHADGIIVAGHELPDGGYPCVWEHKCVNAKNWRAIERDGVEKAFPQYRAQVLLYQKFLGVTDHPAIFTATNADTCERFHVLLPYDAAAAQLWIDRAADVIAATRTGELLPRFTDDRTHWRCRMCGHRERCWSAPKQTATSNGSAQAPADDGLDIPECLRRSPPGQLR